MLNYLILWPPTPYDMFHYVWSFFGMVWFFLPCSLHYFECLPSYVRTRVALESPKIPGNSVQNFSFSRWSGNRYSDACKCSPRFKTSTCAESSMKLCVTRSLGVLFKNGSVTVCNNMYSACRRSSNDIISKVRHVLSDWMLDAGSSVKLKSRFQRTFWTQQSDYIKISLLPATSILWSLSRSWKNYPQLNA